MPMPSMGSQKKHSNHLRLLEKLMKDGIAGKILAMRSLRELYELLVSVESFGPFLAFQLTIDLNYSSALNFDEAEFVVPGPGALDGISKRSEEHTSELQSLMRISYAVFCLKKKKTTQ